MENVIDDLYFGRIHPCERNSSPEEQQLTGELAEHYDRLLEVMTEELEVLCVNIKYHFPSSVHLGVRSKNYNKDALRFSYNYATLFSKVIT